MLNIKFKHLEDTPYKVLKNVELNFSNRYVFSFNKEGRQLTLKDNSAFVSDFFDKTGKIKSVTGTKEKIDTAKPFSVKSSENP